MKNQLKKTMFLKMSIIGIFGSILLIMGLPIVIFRIKVFDMLVNKLLKIEPGSIAYEIWKTPPVPLYLDIYFFNWTNPEDIEDHSIKPSFKEIGPYRFREYRNRVNISWNPNSTITFRVLRSWEFIEEDSVGNLNDTITTLNSVTMSAANQVKNWSYFMRKAFSFSLSAISPKVHITKTVGELLFDGYQDTYIDLALSFPYLVDTLPPHEKFGYMYGRNGSYTYDGIYNVNNDQNENLGEVEYWNYENETHYYPKPCSKVHGSAGDFYKQNLKKDKIGFFLSEACRYVQLDYEKETKVKNILGYKYSAQQSLLDNGTYVEENKCYCNGDCIPNGLINASSCRYGTPSFVSLPHFYGADPIYLDMVDGMKPEKEKHDLKIVLEPRTGLPLDGAIRFQLNVLLFPIEDITLYQSVPKVYVPVLWFEQKASVPEDIASQMDLLLNIPNILLALGLVFIIIGLILIAYLIDNLLRLFINEKKCNYKIVDNHIKQEWMS